MARSKTPEQSPWPARYTNQEGDVNRYTSLPTPTVLKTTALFGIPLRSALTGEEVTDDALQHYINVAIGEIESEFDLYINPVEFYDRYDYDAEMFRHSFAFLQLKHPNVLDVDQVDLSFSNEPDTEIVEFPMEFVYVNHQEGNLQLVPAYGTSFSGFLLSAFSGAQYHALKATLQNGGKFPGGIWVKYRCGFKEDEVPAAVAGLIESLAAYKLLSMLGPVLFPLNSVGISIDGVSQSTGSMGPQFLATRMGDLEKIIEAQKNAVRAAFQRGILVDFI